MLAVSNVLLGVGFWLTDFANSSWGYAGTVVIWTLGEIGTAGLVGSLVSDLAPPEARGRYAAVWGTSFGVATLTAPLLGTRLYQYVGPTALWTACLLGGLLAAAGFVALQPSVHRRLGVATEPLPSAA